MPTGRLKVSFQEALFEAILGWRTPGKTLTLGLCGPQGSGKSTTVSLLSARLQSGGLTTACLSIDDLYLTRLERADLAQSAHPLLTTRGVPGTHDVPLGLEVLQRLKMAGQVALPRFDKAIDDRSPPNSWPMVSAPVDVILLEGWCVGAVPEPTSRLTQAVNGLERQEDPIGTWRTFVNQALAGDYQILFGQIERLVLLRPPAFEVVVQWRQAQEADLRARTGADPLLTLSDDQIVRFVAHYERLSRWIDTEMPSRADLVVQLDQNRHGTIVHQPNKNPPGHHRKGF